MVKAIRRWRNLLLAGLAALGTATLAGPALAQDDLFGGGYYNELYEDDDWFYDSYGFGDSEVYDDGWWDYDAYDGYYDDGLTDNDWYYDSYDDASDSDMFDI